jgi:hypothetical protein
MRKKLTYEEVFENEEAGRSFLNALRVITSPITNYCWTDSQETYLNTYTHRFYLLVMGDEIAVTLGSLKLLRRIPILAGIDKEVLIRGLEQIGFQKRCIEFGDSNEVCWVREMTKKEKERINPVKITEEEDNAPNELSGIFEKIKMALITHKEKYGEIEDEYIYTIAKEISRKGYAKNFFDAEAIVKSAVSQI